MVDSVDVHFLREESGAKLGVIKKKRAKITRERELAVYKTADTVITVTDLDREALVKEPDMSPVFIVPNISRQRPRSSAYRCPEVLFIGGFKKDLAIC